MNDLWQQLNKLIMAGEHVVIATVFNKSGSAPRTDGAKMLIQADGAITGTIGGGKLEAEVLAMAQQVFISKISKVFHFSLQGSNAAETDMICGGQGEVLLDYIDASQFDSIELCSNIINALHKREQAWLLTEMRTDNDKILDLQRCVIKHDSSISTHFACNPAILMELACNSKKVSIYEKVLPDLRILIEPIRSPEILYIFGAGHVSRNIAAIADLVGFHAVILDDRAEFASKERFPQADIVLLSSFDNLLNQVQFDPEGYLVIVTRGHLFDKIVLGQLMGIPSAYLGMIGSKRKRNMIYSALQAEQGLEAADFASVHCPIGLDIAAESPEEIAVSIVAELIKTRAERER